MRQRARSGGWSRHAWSAFVRRVALVVLVVVLGVTASTDQPHSFQYRLFAAAAPHAFNLANWMAHQLIGVPAQPALAGSADAIASYVATVADVQRLEAPARTAGLARRAAPLSPDPALTAARARLARLAPAVERQVATRIGDALASRGLGWSVLGSFFPPVRFRFQAPPHMLVVSQRSAIGVVGAVPLDPTLTVAAMERIEWRAEALGVSALVVPIGGLATYPTMIPPTTDRRWLFVAVAHEWAHNWFTLHPLGWRYALGAERDPRVIMMNETAADLVGQEIGTAAYRQAFPDSAARPAGTRAPGGETTTATSALNRRLAEIRRRVDALLARGEVTGAEAYMNRERDRLESEGWYIRKLNQAFFAFYGNYAEGPSGGPDPVIGQVKALRERAPSLAAFVGAISSLSSYADLERALGGSR